MIGKLKIKLATEEDKIDEYKYSLKQFEIAKKFRKYFNINNFFNSIKKNKKGISVFEKSMELYIAKSCGLDTNDGSLDGGYYQYPGLKNSIKLYSQSDLKSGKIYESLSKGISFIPIIYIFGYVSDTYDGAGSAFEETIGFLNHKEKNKYYVIKYVDGTDSYVNCIDILTIKKNINKTLKEYLIKNYKVPNIGVDDDGINYFILNKDLKFSIKEIKTIFKDLINEIQETKNDYLSENIYFDKRKFELPIILKNKGEFLFIKNLILENNGGFNRRPEYIKKKFNKPDLIL